MKIELNPERMTIAELTDCITELTAQREHLIEDARHNTMTELNLMAMSVFERAQDFREDYELYLDVTVSRGRNYRIPLDARAIRQWQIVAERRKEGED